MESYCPKNKKKKLDGLSDIEAGKYKHINKYFGVRYINSILICGKYNITGYYGIYTVKNDNLMFMDTIINYYNLYDDNFVKT